MSFETPENMDKRCSACRWNEQFNSVCCNADSPHCADFWDDGCDGCSRKYWLTEVTDNEN